MDLFKNSLYHFYNQRNNHEKIFYNRENKLFFLHKIRKYISPTCKILAYCLMPNHFHFLLYATKDSIIEKKVGSLTISNLRDGFRHLLSSYARQLINRKIDQDLCFDKKRKPRS